MAWPNTNIAGQTINRLRLIYAVLVVVVGIFGVRLFYLQIIRYSHYKAAALQQQEADYTIPAARGLIEAHGPNGIEPLVLNQTLYTLYCDPKFITNASSEAAFVANVIGGNASDYESAMRTANRYDILAKKIPPNKKDVLMAAKKPGLNVEAHTYRVYPEGELAAQVLGFVNDSGQGTYGIEQVLNSELSGKAGRVKAITDVRGVPLPASGDNVDIQPQAGKNVALTLNIPLQREVEQALQQGLKQANSSEGSAIVMDVHTGAVVAMANYPTYNPGDYASVTDPSVFNNRSVASQLEVGSIMKVLTTAA
ncbi:MAG TPA: penicillin-binding transpeptidase domain-containing protein, partial [Candidatus Saccharimonadales bacterium]|nr:penicillin-binding transpeptidase domain-containing protein [Candidatus Saccharimonadales bacterium]